MPGSAGVDTSQLTNLIAGLRRAADRTPQLLTEGVAELARDIAAAVQAEVPVKTGALRASVGVDATGTRAIVRVGAGYAGLVLTGTRPHVIRPIAGGILRFVIGGRTIFAREVQHPGVAANDYVGRALRRVQPRERAQAIGVQIAQTITRGGA